MVLLLLRPPLKLMLIWNVNSYLKSWPNDNFFFEVTSEMNGWFRFLENNLLRGVSSIVITCLTGHSLSRIVKYSQPPKFETGILGTPYLVTNQAKEKKHTHKKAAKYIELSCWNNFFRISKTLCTKIDLGIVLKWLELSSTFQAFLPAYSSRVQK